jgi:hypothetical protein
VRFVIASILIFFLNIYNVAATRTPTAMLRMTSLARCRPWADRHSECLDHNHGRGSACSRKHFHMCESKAPNHRVLRRRGFQLGLEHCCLSMLTNASVVQCTLWADRHSECLDHNHGRGSACSRKHFHMCESNAPTQPPAGRRRTCKYFVAMNCVSSAYSGEKQ